MVAINNVASTSTSTSNLNASYMYAYQVDLIRAGRKKAVVATTADGGVIIDGSNGTYMQVRPYTILMNMDLANQRYADQVEELGIMGQTGWVERSYDAIIGNYISNVRGIKTHQLRMEKTAGGIYDQLASHLMNIPDDEEILDTLIKMDLTSKTVFKNGVSVLVDEDTFDVESRDFQSVTIYFDDLRMGALKENPNSLIGVQQIYLDNYRMEVEEMQVSNKMGIFGTAAKANSASTRVTAPAKIGGQSKSSILEGLERARTMRFAGIGGTSSSSSISTRLSASVPKPGSAIAAAIRPKSIKEVEVEMVEEVALPAVINTVGGLTV